jgi:hypothetical protein
MKASNITRRSAISLLAMSTMGLAVGARANPPPSIKVWKDPNCGCCTGWVDHLRQNGFIVTLTDTAAMKEVKARLGVPPELASCHTATIGDYVIEGHVPAHAIKRLIAEKIPGRGLAVPGMPIGSPGMEGGIPEIYDVVLYGPQPSKSYGRYKGDQPV